MRKTILIAEMDPAILMVTLPTLIQNDTLFLYFHLELQFISKLASTSFLSGFPVSIFSIFPHLLFPWSQISSITYEIETTLNERVSNQNGRSWLIP
jgi:hypothetical protein